jgi:WD40 repeat protein
MWIGEASGGGLASFAFTPDGTTMYTGDDFGRVLAWDLQTHEYQELYELATIHGGRLPVWQLALTPDTTRLFIPAHDRIHVLNLPDGIPGKHLSNTPPLLPQLGISPDGRRLVAASHTRHVALWDAKTLERREVPGSLAKLKDVVYVAFIENGARMLVIRQTGEEVSVWNAKTGELTDVLSTKEVWCRICAISSDASSFAACALGGLEARVYGLPDWTLRATIRHHQKIEALAINPTGELLALTDGTKQVAMWNTKTGSKVGEWNWRIGKVHGVAFAPDGLTCVAGGVGRFAVFDVDV